jgi:uncharacterized protein
MKNRCLGTKCIQCCIETNMLLSYHDIEKIQEMGYDPQFFVLERNGWLQLKNHKGRCVFHNGMRCTIYKQRPEGCTLYPVVYDKDNNCATIDQECPQKQSFFIKKNVGSTLITLISTLQRERTRRKKPHIK